MPTDSDRTETISGMGGWLTFFCAVTIVINPFLTVRLMLTPSYQYQNSDLIGIVVSILGIIAGLYVYYRPESGFLWLRIYFYSIAGLILFNFIDFFVLLSQMHSEGEGEAVGTLLGWSVIRPAIFLLIWVSYFRASKRVRNTFGANLTLFPRRNPKAFAANK